MDFLFIILIRFHDINQTFDALLFNQQKPTFSTWLESKYILRENKWQIYADLYLVIEHEIANEMLKRGYAQVKYSIPNTYCHNLGILW